MPSTIIPKALELGETIAFISPSARLNDQMPAVMARATAVLTGQGYKVRELFSGPDTSIQASIRTRLSEIRTAFSDPGISAIICTIGGSAFTELLPALIADTDLHATIRANPKIVVGYSDITGFHWFLHALTGLRTFYGPGAIPELGDVAPLPPPLIHNNNISSDFEDPSSTPLAFCVKHLLRAITNRSNPLGPIPRSATYAPRLAPFFAPGQAASTEAQPLAPNPGWVWLRRGRGQGRLFGGCLKVVARLAGVRAIAPDWRGRVVFLETAMGEDHESGHPLYRVQAGFADLLAQGAFDGVAGLVIGRPFGYDGPEMREQYAGVITGLLCGRGKEGGEFPILFGVDFGHTTPMVTLPFDALAELDSEKDQFAVLEPGVI
ncbi:hypothetical protein SLS62_010782 [Diatrype stigma]|uniref:Uncharacterized protein n=1 Tax=Diatrype stigma TaxID=117547 RepID=A0AAN9YH43_9PEZI